MKASNYLIEVHSDPGHIDAAQWDELLFAQARSSPFMQHAYLNLLHTSGCATAATGWQPQFITVSLGGQLEAACPAYLKNHSYGEYVFDWAWAQAYHRHGLRYYPKLVVAVPFTPVEGPRLMARNGESRRLLVQALVSLARERQASSIHVLFCPGGEVPALGDSQTWLPRQGLQFHWQQPRAGHWPDLDSFLTSLHRDKRKKILQERRRVTAQGVVFETLEGTEISDADWAFFHRCYLNTYREHGSAPYLSEGFFREVGRAMPKDWLLFIASRAGRRVAASLLALDPAHGAAFGRYWGSLEPVDCLHFEACYYQPLAWCMAKGYVRFEGGAQGTHKLARGLLPASTNSAHWVAHEGFRQALSEHLQAEHQEIGEAAMALALHSPFRPEP